MFKKLEIENFRGIRTSVIDNMSQVNLLFGKNNSGKSSILEALLLISGQSNPTLPLNVNGLRGYTSFAESDLLLDFYNLQAEKITIAADGEVTRSLEITPFQSNDKNISLADLGQHGSQQEITSYGLRLNYKLGNDSFSSIFLVTKKNETEGKATVDKRYKEKLYAEYLPASYIQIPVVEQYARIVADKQEETVVEILRAIEPKIKDLQLVGNQLLVDIGLERRLPINVMGDGVRKMLSIVLCMHRCRNGILLIDEIDNGFHHSVMANLWEAVFMSAAANNTQVFVTTHNIESVKEMITMLRNEKNESYRSMLSAYKLIKDSTDKVENVRFQYEQIDYSIKQEMEIR